MSISADDLLISDPDIDIDTTFHTAFVISLFGGNDYSLNADDVIPNADFNGLLHVPITVSDGFASSQVYQLQISVLPVNDAPIITGQRPLETLERSPLTIDVTDLTIVDPDNESSQIIISVKDGVGYQHSENSITPDAGVVGDLLVPVSVTDGDLNSNEFMLLVTVLPDLIAPQLTVLGSPDTILTVGQTYIDAGAIATDNVDGEITDRIVVENAVNPLSVGTYTVAYNVSDLAGNSASANRTVTVKARPVQKRSGGSADPILLALLLLAARKKLTRA